MLSNNTKIRDELDSILKELKNEDLADAVNPDKVLELRKKLNPYGRTIEGSDCVMNFSITQISHEYWRNFIITAMASFLHRMCDEWKVPDGLPVVTVYEALDDPSKMDTPQSIIDKGVQSVIYDYEFNRKWMDKRKIVKEFLEEFLQFNPEEHVRSVYRPNRKDTDRAPVETQAAKTAINHLMRTDKEFKSNEQAYQEMKKTKEAINSLDHTNRSTSESAATSTNESAATSTNESAAISTNESTSESTNESQSRMNKGNTTKSKKSKKVIVNKTTGERKVIEKETRDESHRESDSYTKSSNSQPSKQSKEHVLKSDGTIGKDPNLPYNARAFIPPADTFHRLKIYTTENYEELRKATDDLFCQKTQLELAINPYSWHTGDKAEEEAEAFRKKHSEEVIAEIFPAHSGKWNFFDSWKEQRESTNFYNPNTVVLEEIIKQVERDERIGQDMMKKRVHNNKKKNVIETGPDSEAFKKWRDQNIEIKKMGAQHISGNADDDCPSDAVQVDIWRLSKTGQQLTKEKMFTQAEAPLFVKEAQDKELEKLSKLSEKKS